MSNAFSGGVGKGGLTKTEEIRLLVLYVLQIASVPFSMESITQSITNSALANYFEVTNAVKSLCDDLLVLKDDESNYLLTDEGKSCINELKSMLNFYVLEEAKRQTSKQVLLARRLKENEVKITPVGSGYNVSISMTEQGREFFGFNIYVGTLNDAQTVKQRFLDDPMAIYSSNIKLLLGFDVNENKE